MTAPAPVAGRPAFLFRMALTAFLTLAAASRAETEITLHVGWAGSSPAPVTLTCRPSGKSFELEGYEGSPGPAFRMPMATTAEITVFTELGKRAAGTWKIPTEGDRFILLMTGDGKGGFRTTAVCADTTHFPWGAAAFANLSAKRLRCSLDGQTLELATGEQGLCPLRLKTRKVTHCRVEYQRGKEWIVSSAGPLILTGDMRAIIAIGPTEGPDGTLPQTSVIESNPASTMVPASPVTVPPPLPDQPAK